MGMSGRGGGTSIIIMQAVVFLLTTFLLLFFFLPVPFYDYGFPMNEKLKSNEFSVLGKRETGVPCADGDLEGISRVFCEDA